MLSTKLLYFLIFSVYTFMIDRDKNGVIGLKPFKNSTEYTVCRIQHAFDLKIFDQEFLQEIFEQ